MRLYFLRHGIADRSAWEGSEFDRPLTRRGIEKMEAEARTMVQLGMDLDCIVTSPLVRASQTAEIVARALGLVDSLEARDELDPGFDAPILQELLAEFPDDHNLMLVGHEPSFSETIGVITGGGEVICKKGSLARVDLFDTTPPAGELVWLIPPKALTL